MNAALARLMDENLKQVWSERDATIRLEAIRNIYLQDAGLFHAGDKQRVLSLSITV